MIEFKNATGQGDDYTTRCLLYYPYFEKCYYLIAIHLRKQQNLDADLQAIQQINFTGNLDATMFFIFEEVKETVLDFSNRSITILFCFNIILI